MVTVYLIKGNHFIAGDEMEVNKIPVDWTDADSQNSSV